MDKPVSDKLLKLIPPAGIALVIGSEGSGKSNLGYGILESVKDTGRKLLVYGLPLEKAIHLPDWIGVCTTMDFPEESVVLADEAYISFHSRSSMSQSNKFMDTFSGLVRQKDILAIYITQSTRKLDIGLVSAPRVLLIKRPSLLQTKMDRSELRSIITGAADAFHRLELQHLIEGDNEPGKLGADTVVNPYCLNSTYVISNTFEGMIENSNVSPSFWSTELSKAWKSVSIQDNKQEPSLDNLNSYAFPSIREAMMHVYRSIYRIIVDSWEDMPELREKLYQCVNPIETMKKDRKQQPDAELIIAVRDSIHSCLPFAGQWSAPLSSILSIIENMVPSTE